MGFDTPLGRMILLAEDTSTENKKATSIQLIGLGFAGIKMNDEAVIADLSRQLGCQNVLSNPEKLRPLATQILNQPHKVPVSLRGTDFQKKCGAGLWKFQQVLQPHMERFLIICKARRAQSVPLSANPISLLVPCHRVIGSTGQLHGYRWGLDIKKSLLAAEGAPVSVAL